MAGGWTARSSNETGLETNNTACQDEKTWYLATCPPGRNHRFRNARRCPDLRVELPISHGHSRKYRKSVVAVDVLRAGRMPLFVTKSSSGSCFQQSCRRISGESLQDRNNRT